MQSLLAGFSLTEIQRLRPAGQRFGGVKGPATTWPPKFPGGTRDVGPIAKQTIGDPTAGDEELLITLSASAALWIGLSQPAMAQLRQA